jgi:hypothetical protein
MFKPAESLTERIIWLETQRDNLRILLSEPEVPQHLKENIQLALACFMHEGGESRVAGDAC